jgi:RimJ/RimL family protein N-acetyltransferase
MKIRVAEERDALAVARGEWETAATPGLLVGRPGEIPASAYTAKISTLASLGCYWVAEEQGALIGHAFIEPMNMAANSHVFQLNIVVYPEFTDHGIGTALMTELLSWARRNARVEKIELLVRATNTRAIKLYTKFHFVEEGRLRRRVRTSDGDYVDDVAMALFPERAGAAQQAGAVRRDAGRSA